MGLLDGILGNVIGSMLSGNQGVRIRWMRFSVTSLGEAPAEAIR